MTETAVGWTEEEVFERFRAILADVLVLGEDEIERSSKLVDDLDADSIGFLELTWRLRQDFAVPVPEVKVDEETLTMSMLEGLERIGNQAGGVTLFEFMKDATARGADSAFGVRAAAIVKNLVDDPEFPDRLRSAITQARGDEQGERALVSMLQDVRSSPDVAAAFDNVLNSDPDLAADVAALYGDMAAPVDARPTEAARLWAQLLTQGEAARQLFGLRVRDLGGLLGSGVPDGLDSDGEVSALILRDLFRFITVDAYVQYILFLHESEGDRGASA
jgi:acyl carrier protein